MFARAFTADLKPGQGTGFTIAVDHRVMPILSKCEGFRDEVVLLSTDDKRAVAISFWDHPEHAEQVRRTFYSLVLEALAPFIAGTPIVATYDVTFSIAHQVLSHMATA